MGRVIFVSEQVFACYSKSCAPPPTGKGGSSAGGMTKARQQAYVKDMLAARKTTTVTRDGNIAVTNGGGKMPRFRMRPNKSSAWLANRRTTAISAARIKEILK